MAIDLVAVPNERDQLDEILADDQAIRVDFRSLGTTGLRRAGGIIQESTLKGLDGRRAIEIFKEMGENDVAIACVLNLILNIVRGVKWYVRDASDDPRDLEAGDLIRTCMHDMDMPWDDYVAEAMSMIQYGYSTHELVYKRRAGRAPESWLRSKYQDGRVGWRGFPIRSQDTTLRWTFDDAGALQGVVGMDPWTGNTWELPLEKMLLFRTTSHKNNPEGLSSLRRCYRPFYFKRIIEEAEAIGIQRDLAGLPVIKIPAEIMLGKTESHRRQYQAYKELVTKIRRDALEGVVMPSQYDDNGNEMYSLSLLSSGGSRQFDTRKSIDAYKLEIYDSFMAGFLSLGQGTNSSGSWAMHNDKAKLFLMAIKPNLTQFKNVINLHAIPRLLEMNGMEVTDYPQIDHTPLEQVDMTEMAAVVLQLSQAGMPIAGNPDIERRIFEICGLPVAADTDQMQRQRDQMPATTAHAAEDMEEVHPDTPAAAPATMGSDAMPRSNRNVFRPPSYDALPKP